MNTLDIRLLEKNIDDVADYDFSNNKVFGSAYYVYQKGSIVFEKCYGKTGLSGDNVKNNTIFRLASMTKPITAFSALILAERGLLSLDDNVGKYLPEFNNVHIIDADGNDLGKPKRLPTLRNILSHCSAIGSNPQKMARMTVEQKQTIDSSIDFLIGAGLDFEPATAQQYSGVGAFDVLVKIIEMVSGKDFQSFLTEEIFDPCEMVDTTFMPSEEQYERFIKMHGRNDNGENYEFKMFDGCTFGDFPCTHFLGGAGLVSTLKDYGNFAKMLLNKGNFNGKQLLKEETFSLLCTPQVPQSIMDWNERWGLGVRVICKEEYPYLPVGTFGWSGAFGSHFWVDPVNEIVAVFMKNSAVDGGSANESAQNFEKAVYSSFNI